MIYHYEAGILRYVNKFLPDITLMSYAKQDEVFNMMSEVTKFPAFYYYREPTNWEFNRSFETYDENFIKTSFVPFEQKYVGRILVDSQKTAFQVANALRFNFHKLPYVHICWPNKESRLKVALRLLYIKVDEQRTSGDRKGPLRFVEFSWRSDLFMSLTDETSTTLVEEVRIYLNPENAVVSIEKGNDIIKIIT